MCKHCRADAQHHANPRQLSTEDGLKLLDALASYPRPYPLVVLTGGDPCEREDLEQLVEYGTSLGLNVSISPSVTPKLTPERISSLREAGAKAMILSAASPEHSMRRWHWPHMWWDAASDCKSIPP